MQKSRRAYFTKSPSYFTIRQRHGPHSQLGGSLSFMPSAPKILAEFSFGFFVFGGFIVAQIDLWIVFYLDALAQSLAHRGGRFGLNFFSFSKICSIISKS